MKSTHSMACSRRFRHSTKEYGSDPIRFRHKHRSILDAEQSEVREKVFHFTVVR